jgi:hypothetical protein
MEKKSKDWIEIIGTATNSLLQNTENSNQQPDPK